MNRAVAAPAAATSAPPKAGPSTKVSEKATFRAALAERSAVWASFARRRRWHGCLRRRDVLDPVSGGPGDL